MGHLRYRLVAQATEDEDARLALAGEESFQAGTQGPGSGRVVRDVENPGNAASLDALQAGGPAGFVNACSDCGRGNGKALIGGEFNRRGDGQGQVAVLVRAGERGIDRHERAESLHRI